MFSFCSPFIHVYLYFYTATGFVRNAKCYFLAFAQLPFNVHILINFRSFLRCCIFVLSSFACTLATIGASKCQMLFSSFCSITVRCTYFAQFSFKFSSFVLIFFSLHSLYIYMLTTTGFVRMSNVTFQFFLNFHSMYILCSIFVQFFQFCSIFVNSSFSCTRYCILTTTGASEWHN